MPGTVTPVYEGAASVTPSDTVADPAGPFAGLFVTAAGTLKIRTIRGDDVTLSVLGGYVVPIATTRVWVTGTVNATCVGLTSGQYRPVLNPGSGVVLP